MIKNLIFAIFFCFVGHNLNAQNTSKVKINLMPCEFKGMEIQYSKSGLVPLPTTFEKVSNKEVTVPSNSYVHFRFKYLLSEANPLMGLSVLDIILMQKHILGIKMIESDIKLIAADTNNNGKVTTSDIVELRKKILGLSAEKNTVWMMMPPSLDVVHTIDDTFTFWIEKDTTLNFMPFKSGDANQNFGCD